MSIGECPGHVPTPLGIGQSGVGGERMSLSVDSLSVRRSVPVRRPQLQLPEIGGGCFCSVIIRPYGIVHLLHVWAESSMILLHRLLSSCMQLWNQSIFPLFLAEFLRLCKPMGTMVVVVAFRESDGGIIGLCPRTIDVRLDLLNVRRKVGIVIGLEIWCDECSSFEIWLAELRTVFVQLRHRGRTPEQCSNDAIP